MERMLKTLEQRYEVIKKEAGYVAVTYFPTLEAYKQSYLVLPAMLAQIERAVDQGFSIFCSISFSFHPVDRFQVQAVDLFKEQKGETQKIHNPLPNRILHSFAAKQLVKDAGLPPFFDPYNWEEKYQEVQHFPFPDALNGFTLKKNDTYYPYMMSTSGFSSSAPCVVYTREKPHVEHVISITKTGEYKTKSSEASYATIEEAFMKLKEDSKDNRLRYLFSLS